ncbi:hypothetical protein EBT31_23350 [bacterium]|nr:hypothetical protein [bacterium]
MTEDYQGPTPPPELVEEWRTAPECTNGWDLITMVSMTTRRLQEIADKAANWGYQQAVEELEAFLKKGEDK